MAKAEVNRRTSGKATRSSAKRGSTSTATSAKATSGKPKAKRKAKSETGTASGKGRRAKRGLEGGRAKGRGKGENDAPLPVQTQHRDYAAGRGNTRKPKGQANPHYLPDAADAQDDQALLLESRRKAAADARMLTALLPRLGVAWPADEAKRAAWAEKLGRFLDGTKDARRFVPLIRARMEMDKLNLKQQELCLRLLGLTPEAAATAEPVDMLVVMDRLTCPKDGG